MSQAFYLPTRVLSGEGCVTAHAPAFQGLGTKALIVTGRRSAVATGALADVTQALASQGVAFVVYDQIPPNPGLKEVREAAALGRTLGVDFVIGIGGGSPLDAAKAIAILVVNDLDDSALFRPPFPVAPLPIVAVPTTAGTGSEVTPYAILTNDAVQSKSNIAHESLFPRLAFLDARYTAGLPRNVTVNTALDALSHVVEGYLAVRATEFSDLLALGALADLGPALRDLAQPGLPSDSLRRTLLRAATTAGMVIAHTGTTAVHALGYSLTYFKDIDHGRANALTLAAYLGFVAQDHGERVAAVLRALGCPNLGALKGLLDQLLGPKESLTAAEIQRFAALAFQTRNIANTIRKPSVEDLKILYGESLVDPDYSLPSSEDSRSFGPGA